MISLQTILIIIICIIATIILTGLFILTWFLSKKRAQNNILKGLILFKNGTDVKSYKAVANTIGKNGIRYTFDYENKKRAILVPNKYTPEFNNHRRLIFIGSISQLISSPLNPKEKLSSDERSDLIYELFETNFIEQGIKALQGNKNPKAIITIIIIAIIAVVLAIIGYNYVSNSMQVPQASPTIVNTANLSTPVEVK